MPWRSRIGYSPTRRMPDGGQDVAGDALVPAAGEPVVDPFAEQHQQGRRSRPATLAPRLGDGTQLVARHAAPERAVERPSRRSDADDGGEEGQRRGDREHRDRTDVRHVLPDVTARVVQRDARGEVEVGTAPADDVDRDGPVEPVEGVQPRRRGVRDGDHPGCQRGGHRPGLERDRRAAGGQHVRERRRQGAVGQPATLDPPADPELPRLGAGGDAVLDGHQCEQFSHTPPWASRRRGNGNRGGCRGWRRLVPCPSSSISNVVTTASPSSPSPTAR